ncbi:MAG: hypothetical protein J5855_09510 [Mailhella sp.]|nr:hypothetical protein [Mailhella sp.]
MTETGKHSKAIPSLEELRLACTFAIGPENTAFAPPVKPGCDTLQKKAPVFPKRKGEAFSPPLAIND